MNTNYKATYIFRGLLFAVLFLIVGVYIGNLIPWGLDFIEVFYYIVIGTTFVTLCVYTLWECDERNEEDYEKLLKGKFLPVKFPGRIITFMVLIIVIHQLILTIVPIKNVYNQSVVYYKQYDKATQGLQSLYDNFWKTYATKNKVTGLNKEAVIEAARIGFEARKDGPGLQWKWLQENLRLPYEELTTFYKELSAYVEAKRNEYQSLEEQRQGIAASHNMLIDTFPNNLYNRIINRKHIIYKYGLLSDSTAKVFSTGKEDPQ